METPTDHAEWLLKALGRRSPRPIAKMEPSNSLETLELDDLDIRSLTDSMRTYIKERNKDATLAKAEVAKAKTIRGELQLMVKKIDETDLPDDEADSAIVEAKERIRDAQK